MCFVHNPHSKLAREMFLWKACQHLIKKKKKKRFELLMVLKGDTLAKTLM